jgi:hypothetical protein
LTEGVSPLHETIKQKFRVPLDSLMPTFGLQANLMRGGPQLSVWIAIILALLITGTRISRARS